MTPISTRLSRRRLIQGAGAIGVAGALSACASATADGRVPVQLWHLFTGGDGGVFQSMIQTVQESLPEYQINPVVLTWGGPYYTKLTMASVGGRAPDLAVMHLTRVFGYAPGGLLDPWDLDRLASMGITEDKFQPALWERAFVGDKMYALPLDFHAFVQFFNTDICGQAGVLDGNGRLVGVDSPDGYVEVGREVAKVTGQQGISYGYTSDGAQMSRMFWGLYHQTGADVVLNPGSQAVFDTDAAAEVVKFVQSWLDDSIALRNQDYGSSLASFSNGRSG